MDPNAPIILLDIHTNQLVAYWVELDHSSDIPFTEARNRSLMIWPAHRLTDGHTYIVVIRYMKTNDGVPITPSPAFKVSGFLYCCTISLYFDLISK